MVTDAELSRRLCAGQGHGALATLAREPAGTPYASLVAYALDAAGNPLFFLSRLAEHTANFLADPRASLLVTESGDSATLAAGSGGDPLARGRVTLLGRVVPVAPEEAGAARERFLARHPEASFYVALPDFAFYRLQVGSVRYVGGFGRMSWIDAREYAAAQPE
jgi:putative heme iron utilization protein